MLLLAQTASVFFSRLVGSQKQPQVIYGGSKRREDPGAGGARAGAERNERAEPERRPAEAGVITAAGTHAAFIYVSFECS